MKTKYKYFLLVIITIVASILIYNFIEENTSVKTKKDVLILQKEIEKTITEDMDYTIDDPKVILNPYKVSPLTALVVFKTNDLASAVVTIKGKDNDEDITNTFIPSKEHLITIYGLYPDYENTVIINVSGEEKILKIQTDKLPENINDAKVINEEEDFYFTTSINGYPIAYDKNGNVRWYLTKKYSWDFTRLSNGYLLLGNSDLMKEPYYSSSLVEMDLLGKIYYEYYLEGGYHHDVYEKTDGNLIAISNDFNSLTTEDLIVELDRNTGNVIKKFDLSKLFKNKKGNWISLNSIAYNQDTNSILAVGSKKDMIVNIDYTTGEINWLIADKDNIDKKYQKYLLSGDGEIEFPINPNALTLISGNKFAYVNSKDNENHLITYDVNTTERTFIEKENINLGKKRSTINLDYNNGEYIVTQGNLIKKVQDDEAITVLELNSDIYSAKASKIYAGDMLIPGQGQRLGTTGITSTVKDKMIIFYKKDTKIFKKYNLSITSDATKLKIKGTFNKNDKVQIVLDNVLSKKTYDVDLKNGVKENNKVKTVTYINKQGIYGKYYIFIKINGKTYKLSKYAIMS